MSVTRSPIGGRLYRSDDIKRPRRRTNMIQSIHIEGYRGFTDFEMNGLGRVNLLVGANNSGKTSVLEALFLLSSRGDTSAIWQVLSRRGERFVPGETDPRFGNQIELDLRHLFTGHEIHSGSKFQ